MRTIVGRMLFFAVFLLFGSQSRALCQVEDLPDEDTAPPARTRIKIESANAIPGASFSIPVFFTPAKGIEVGTVKIAVNFCVWQPHLAQFGSLIWPTLAVDGLGSRVFRS